MVLARTIVLLFGLHTSFDCVRRHHFFQLYFQFFHLLFPIVLANALGGIQL